MKLFLKLVTILVIPLGLSFEVRADLIETEASLSSTVSIVFSAPLSGYNYYSVNPGTVDTTTESETLNQGISTTDTGPDYAATDFSVSTAGTYSIFDEPYDYEGVSYSSVNFADVYQMDSRSIGYNDPVGFQYSTSSASFDLSSAIANLWDDTVFQSIYPYSCYDDPSQSAFCDPYIYYEITVQYSGWASIYYSYDGLGDPTQVLDASAFANIGLQIGDQVFEDSIGLEGLTNSFDAYGALTGEFAYSGLLSKGESISFSVNGDVGSRAEEIVSVPEPGTLVLLVIALAGMGLARRKIV